MPQGEPGMSKRLEFYFDYGSPFSYLADAQLAELARRTGAAIVYEPILLGAVLKSTGNASPMAVPAKGKYMGTERRRWAQCDGVPAPANSHLPANTLRIMRGGRGGKAPMFCGLPRRDLQSLLARRP